MAITIVPTPNGVQATDDDAPLAHLERTDRLAVLGIRASATMHEINNALGYVDISASVLQNRLLWADALDREELLALVGTVREGLARMRDVARELLAVGRVVDDEPAVDVAAALDAAERVVEHRLQARARLVRKFPPLPEVRGARCKLERIFVNLLLNAANAIPASRTGTIVVSARVEPGHVVLVFEDDGEGVAEADLERIFDPFYTTSAEGSGLGLSICRSILARIGGSIVASSARGRGTAMTLCLPRRHRDNVDPSDRPTVPCRL
jgi:signal transduction histidine kinase